jgi:peptidoglycan hydrolase CwlO-like protein
MPARRRTSVWTWVFATLSVLLLLGAGGLGYVYNEARGTIADQKSEITNLQETVDGHTKTISDKDGLIRQREQDIGDLEDDLNAEKACSAAVRKTLQATDEAAFNVAYDEMVAECV